MKTADSVRRFAMGSIGMMACFYCSGSSAAILFASTFANFGAWAQGQSWATPTSWADSLVTLGVVSNTQLIGPNYDGAGTWKSRGVDLTRPRETAISLRRAAAPATGSWTVAGRHMVRVIGNVRTEIDTSSSTVVP